MTLIDDFMPSHSLHQIDHVAVASEPAATWAAVRAFDLYQIRWVRALFRLRTTPARVSGRLHGQPAAAEPTARIQDITGETGFQVLGETAGREVAVGSIGKFWQPRIEFARVSPAEFVGFAQPGFGKLVWSLRVDPRQGGGSWITFELRVGATETVSLARFRRYWWLIGRFSHAIRHAMLAGYQTKLGAIRDASRMLPGDELLPEADAQRTHAITIEAPPARVWPWLIQMGCQRAGYYSLDRLDNAGRPSADQIVPELQHLAVGDIVPARPTGPDGFLVLRMEPERVLVIGSPELGAGTGQPWTSPYVMTWAFHLEPVGDAATRLVVRVRGRYQPRQRVRAQLIAMAALAAHEIMERAQLAGLKQRAEAH